MFLTHFPISTENVTTPFREILYRSSVGKTLFCTPRESRRPPHCFKKAFWFRSPPTKAHRQTPASEYFSTTNIPLELSPRGAHIALRQLWKEGLPCGGGGAIAADRIPITHAKNRPDWYGDMGRGYTLNKSHGNANESHHGRKK